MTEISDAGLSEANRALIEEARNRLPELGRTELEFRYWSDLRLARALADALSAVPPVDTACTSVSESSGSATAHPKASEPSAEGLLDLMWRMRTVAVHARGYYDGYCQDEADTPDYVGCSDEQHRDAAALRDALKDYDDAETVRAIQRLAALPNTPDLPAAEGDS